jgi:hypothetical protein
MAMSREQARNEHTTQMNHDQFNETMYGVICAACHNYILIDHTNCPRSLPRTRVLPTGLHLISNTVFVDECAS